MTHTSPQGLRSLSTIGLLLATVTGCALRRQATPTGLGYYSQVLSTNDARLHPRIVRLVRYTGALADEPIEEPVEYGFPGFLFVVLAPENEKGTNIWKHYCDQPLWHESVAKVNRVYLMRLRSPDEWGRPVSSLGEPYTANETQCFYYYQFRELP